MRSLCLRLLAVAVVAAAAAAPASARRLAVAPTLNTGTLQPPPLDRTTMCDLAQRYSVRLRGCGNDPASSIGAAADAAVRLAPAPAPAMAAVAFTAPAEVDAAVNPIDAAVAAVLASDAAGAPAPAEDDAAPPPAAATLDPSDPATQAAFASWVKSYSAAASPPSLAKRGDDPTPAKTHAAAAAVGVTSMAFCIFIIWWAARRQRIGRWF